MRPNHKIKMSKCLSKDRNHKPCRNFSQDGSRFCKNHQYMNDYTPEMLEATQLCGTCHKMYFFEPGVKVCDKCKAIGQANREKARDNIVLCKSEGCKFKRSVENIYCGLHQLCLFVDECADEGVRPCTKYLKGCRTKLESSYSFKKCADCLQKEREYDRAKRSAVSGEIVDGLKQCSVCCQRRPIEMYSGPGGVETKTCRPCRDENKRQDEKRDMDHKREIDRIGARKPERQAVKREWSDANPEKVALFHLNCRNRRFTDTTDLTQEQFDSITKNPCYYCNEIQPRGFNGIDRVDSTKGYHLDNCVSACSECNLMKGALDILTFVQRVEHILRNTCKMMTGNKYPDAFANHKGSTYKAYKYQANKRGYEFDMTEEDYYKLIHEACYVCGKKSDENHTNGIDRFDNEKGYTFHNSNACCTECNIMKKDFDFFLFLERLEKIYANWSKKELKPPSVRIINIMNVNETRLSRDERRPASESKK